MKLKLLLLTVLGSVTFANAQFTVTDRSGVVLNEGDVIEFGTLEYPEASYDFYLTNDNTTETIYTRVEYVSETNSTNGDFEQLCYGLCYNNLLEGDTVPPAGEDALPVAVGETTPLGNHFYNDDPGNGSGNVDFVFSFRQYEDAAGTIETGTPLTFTYRYNPTLGVNEVSKVNLTIQSTVISNELVVNANEAVSMLVYDLQGRVVKQANLEAGRQTITMSDLNSQAYILQFKNEKGAVKTTKVIVQ